MFRRPVLGTDRHDVAAFSVLLAWQPISPDAYFHRGLAYGRLADRRALTDLDMFLVLAPADDLRRGEAVRAYARTCNNLAWASVVKTPTDGSVEVTLPLALTLAEKAVALEPGNSNYRNTLGVAMYRLGLCEDAITILEPNVKSSGQHAAFDLYFLAMSYHRLGQPAAARRCFNRANATAQAATDLSAGQRQELADFRAEAEALLREPSSR
jgi:tetratricopeptide (TPR) repeat protein